MLGEVGDDISSPTMEIPLTRINCVWMTVTPTSSKLRVARSSETPSIREAREDTSPDAADAVSPIHAQKRRS